MIARGRHDGLPDKNDSWSNIASGSTADCHDVLLWRYHHKRCDQTKNDKIQLLPYLHGLKQSSRRAEAYRAIDDGQVVG